MRLISAWFDNLSFLRKIIIVYIICGIFPIMAMLTYFFFNTYQLLMERSYNEMNRQMIVTESILESAIQPYKNIIENIKNDRKPNIQLNADYSKLSYTDLAYYLNNTIDNWKSIHDDIKAIRFYTNNDTLPRDDYYFYGIEDLESAIVSKLDENEGNVLFFGRRENQQVHFLLISEMNYFFIGDKQVYVEIELTDDFIHNLMFSSANGRESYLLDSEGTVLYSSEKGLQGHQMNSIVTDWEQISSSTVQSSRKKDGQRILCLKKDMEQATTLLLVDDRNKMIKDALKVPANIACAMIILTVFFFSIMAFYGRKWSRRLANIIEGMKRIGSGDFEHKFEPKSSEEFGQIEAAVDQVSTQINDLIQENYRKQLQMKNTELNLLQEQINPHFLYNALGLISSLSIQERAKQTNQSIRYLAEFYRISLNKGRKIIPVSEEFALLGHYMKIQMLRFPDYVEIEYDLQEAVKDFYMIKLLLQPLVENAIHHARDEEMFLSIKVSAYLEKDRVCFDVSDNGMGMDEEKLKMLRTELLRQEEGFGIKNVDRRIKLNYGQEYGVSIFSKYGEGTNIHLEIPVCHTAKESLKI